MGYGKVTARVISSLAHVGKVLLKVVAKRLNAHVENNNLVSEEQRGFKFQRFTYNMMFVVCRLHGAKE